MPVRAPCHDRFWVSFVVLGVGMRSFWGIVALSAFVAMTPGPAVSEITQPANETATARTQIADAILAEIRLLQGATKDETEAAWLSELAGIYATHDAQPFWTDERGINQRGEAVAKVCRGADDYGLDADAFELPGPSDSQAVAELKLSMAAVKYVWHARGGRVDPSQLSLWLDQTPRVVYASAIVRAIAGADDIETALLSEHPPHKDFEILRRALLQAQGKIEMPKPQPILPGAKIIKGDRHIDVALVRRRLGIPAAESKDETLADGEVIEAVRQFMRQAGYGKKRFAIDDEVRTALNAAAETKPGDNRALVEKLIINMERWRWVPRDFGAIHVWNNIPEFESRIVKDGEVVHRERIIVGKPSTQTPVFSDAMNKIVFQPTWALPPSIKLAQLGRHAGPGIASVLERRNMKIVDDSGRVIRATRINWSRINVDQVPIVQGPGPGNPLGRLKFVFPNSHAVYMHDTPDKYLFNSAERTFSHGCMRVRNPERYAEVILGLTHGWTGEDVAEQLSIKDTHDVMLPEHVQVHVTYFTAVVDGDNRVRLLKDIYGHDKRISDAFAGVPYAKIAARDPALAQIRENRELARRSGARKQKPGASGLAQNRTPARAAQAKPKKSFSFFFGSGG